MSRSNSFVRIPALAIRQRIRPLPRIGVLDEDLLSLRVWPQDIDFNLHLNNARYLSFMDYGRVHLMAATGILTPAIQQRWAPLVGSISVTYRRSLGLFAPFTLTTRLLCWDEKWLYMEQVFEAKGGLAAIAWVKGLFRGAEGNIPSQRVIDMVAPGVASPPVPESLLQWNALTREKLASGE
ncbi:acyl-CoA thioesterase FadM [Silvibacterium bohemicum]|uniref:Acyl-CoA thioesterase FadM n=1 Tax=Silvibacterium bohemicum TaxID=1577686 RepID=A0A841K481_9BACT|nr:thioesterase family protein [Silvibacterium bohemicum]MBB6145438.1 acyl-CoA thioesterase FadM [Silvibacterium bohemicum]